MKMARQNLVQVYNTESDRGQATSLDPVTCAPTGGFPKLRKRRVSTEAQWYGNPGQTFVRTG